MSIFTRLITWFKVTFLYTTETVRARNKKGQYVADDPDTPNINEAYKTSKVKKTSKEGFVRSRNKEGQYVADDESTPDTNEAYTDVKRK